MVLTQLSSASFPMGHVSQFSHCLSALAACFPGELYLPAGEASSWLPGQLKALLPLVFGCVPGVRQQREPWLTQGAPNPACSPGTLFAKAAELQVVIQNRMRVTVLQGDVLVVFCLR